MFRIADLADNYGSGEIRLTVWQNFIIPNIPEAYVETVKKAVRKMGFDYQQSNIASGVIACTGNRYCKFSSTDTKGHALSFDQISREAGQTRSAGQYPFHGMSELLRPTLHGRHRHAWERKPGTAARPITFLSAEGSEQNAACGRQIYQALPFDEFNAAVEKILLAYLKHRQGGESFQSFTMRHDVNSLQVLFQE